MTPRDTKSALGNTGRAVVSVVVGLLLGAAAAYAYAIMRPPARPASSRHAPARIPELPRADAPRLPSAAAVSTSITASPSAASAPSASAFPADLPSPQRVSIVPPAAGVAIDGRAVEVVNGTIALGSKVGSVHLAVLTYAGHSQSFRLTITEQGPEPKVLTWTRPAPAPAPSPAKPAPAPSPAKPAPAKPAPAPSPAKPAPAPSPAKPAPAPASS